MRRPINPAWWDSADLRACLARHDVASVFQFLKRRGFSWAAIAAATDIGPGRVSEIANGKRLVTEYVVFERIAEGLGIPRHYMGLGQDAEVAHHRPRQPAPPVDPQALLGAVASIVVGSIPAEMTRWLPHADTSRTSTIVTADDVATVRAVTAFHRRLDAASGGGACLKSARGYVEWATNLLGTSTADDTVAALLREAVADLHCLVGWVAHDLGQHDTARRHLTHSLVLARQSNALPLLAQGLYRLGRVSLHERQPQQALHFFGLGQLAAQQAGCRASVAILHANTAWAYAQMGAADQVTGSLARARNEIQDVDSAAAPAWTRFALTDADVHGMAAVVYTALADHPEHRSYAETALANAHEAVQARKNEEGRSRVFDVISVAQASTLAGDYSDAVKYGMQAIAMANAGIQSSRVQDRLAALCATAAPHVAHYPDLAQLEAAFHG